MTHSMRKSGYTFVEIMIAIAFIYIIAVGTMGYQFLNIKQSRAAEAQFMATRIGQLLVEDWKSTGGIADYDPESLELGFASPDTGEYGSYVITLGNIPFFVDLQSNEVESDSTAGVTLSQITVTVKWRRDYARGAIASTDPSLTFNTYVRHDQG